MRKGKAKRKVDVTESIPLMRGGSVVSTITGAFGQSLRETRLTALLGYLIATNPDPFLQLFGFKGSAQHVSLETKHETGRSDILVETSAGTGIVEAKVNATDPSQQASRYPAQWLALLTHHVAGGSGSSRARFVTWEELGELLQRLKRSRSAHVRVLSSDLFAYLKEHRMIQSRDSVEVYAREINESVTLELFLWGKLYGCKYQKGSRLAEALYFAPHFGARISNEYPGIRTGISYVARVESVGHATTWREFRELMYETRGAVWWRHNDEILRQLHRLWPWKERHRNFLFLGEPRLVFNPPIHKESLQSGKGWLSKRFLSFDELFAAWAQTG